MNMLKNCIGILSLINLLKLFPSLTSIHNLLIITLNNFIFQSNIIAENLMNGVNPIVNDCNNQQVEFNNNSTNTYRLIYVIIQVVFKIFFKVLLK